MSISAADYMMISEIIDFWFEGCDQGVTIPNKVMQRWFRHDETMDHEICLRFRPQVRLIEEGSIRHWAATAEGRLALILLADQFNRHVNRDNPKMYTLDNYALQWCLQGIRSKVDQRLLPAKRLFFYMPLQHVEDQTLQTLSVLKFNELYQHVLQEHTDSAEPYHSALNYAVQHQQIVKEFGRFPHRNKILGRHPTKFESEFLSQPNSSF